MDLVALEKDKIKGAIRTDFILSAEIIVIALGTVATATFAEQVAVVTGIAVIMTVGVYGLVAGIVKLDDAGFYLSARKGAGKWMNGVRSVGRLLVSAAPKLMKLLSVVGTVAMFMVGGGILTHGWPWASAMLHQAEVAVDGVAVIGPVLAAVTPSLINAIAGVIAGALVLAGVTAVSALLRRVTAHQ